jgi:predicted PurR-regulated permease PerM
MASSKPPKTPHRNSIVISPLTFVYLLLTMFAIWIVFQISSIIISLVVAGIFAVALNPIVSSIEKKLHIRRGFAVAIVVISIVAVFIATVALIVPNLIEQGGTLSSKIPEYQLRIKDFADDKTYTRYIYDKTSAAIQDNTNQISSNVASISVSLAGGLFSFLTFFVFLIYMLVSGRKFAVILSNMLPKKQWRKQFVEISNDISTKLGRWLRGQALLSLIIFVVSYIGLTILDVDYALSLALFAGLMEAVPMVGAYLGAIPAVTVALLSGSPVKAIIVAIFFLVMQQLEGSLVVPQVMKKAVGVHPMLVLLAAMIGGTLLGIVGVLIAVPVTAAASVIIGSLYQKYSDSIEK